MCVYECAHARVHVTASVHILTGMTVEFDLVSLLSKCLASVKKLNVE